MKELIIYITCLEEVHDLFVQPFTIMSHRSLGHRTCRLLFVGYGHEFGTCGAGCVPDADAVRADADPVWMWCRMRIRGGSGADPCPTWTQIRCRMRIRCRARIQIRSDTDSMAPDPDSVRARIIPINVFVDQ